ncbi:MAG: universal stress protein [Deltaproteobacteria bacterium]|nr:universal stress protein [Deltaproteobacteria bacterium]
MKDVLIPTDFSTASKNALESALPILKNGKEPIHVLLLNTFLVPFAPPAESVALHDQLKQYSLDSLEKTRAELEAKTPPGEISFEALSYMGSLENVVAFLVQERKIDCVVLGTDRKSRSDEVIKIMGRVSCPILIVPFHPA